MPFGIALHSDKQFSHRIEAQMKPIIRLFTPIFFVVVGLSLNLHELNWHSSKFWLFSLSLFLVAALGKLLGPFLLRQSWTSRWLIGLAMVPRAEVGLVFAELGHSSGILGQEIYAGLIFVIALTTLLPPVAMKWIHRRYRIREKIKSQEKNQS
jgi:Kef-type K+ transport system membrane component KefB